MKLTERLGAAVKAFRSQKAITGDGWRTMHFNVPGVYSPDWNFANIIKNGYQKNPVIAACLGVWQKSFAEPTLEAFTEDGEEYTDSDIERLLTRPNPWMSFSRFAQFVIGYQILGGDAYLYKRRTPAGRIEMLIPMHAGQCLPIVEPDSKNFIDYYAINTGKGQYVKIPVTEIVQITGMYIDPLNPNTSIPPIKLVAHESETLFLQMQQAMALLKNDAMPRTVIMIDGEDGLSATELDYIKSKFEQRFSGEAFGAPVIMPRGVRAERLSYSPDELTPSAYRDYIEADICAVLQIHPQVVGVKVGLEQSTYNNVDEAKKGFVENSLIPRLASFADDLTRGLDEDEEGFYLEFDLQTIAAYRRMSHEQRQKTYKEIILPIYAAISRKELTPALARVNAEEYAELDTEKAELFFPDDIAPQPEQAESPESIDGQEMAEATLAELVLNGAQMQAATGIARSVALGEIPRDSGIGQLQVLLRLSPAQAEQFMGSAGTSTPTTPNPNPAEEARMTAVATEPKPPIEEEE